MTQSSLNWAAAKAAAAAGLARWDATGPGGTVLGFDRTGTRFAVSAGLADLASGTAFTPDTVARFASVTKHLLCAMVLSHPEVIELSDPLGSHLPELHPALARVSVARALSMTGGLPDTRESLSLLGLPAAAPSGAAGLMAYSARMPALNFPAGRELSYSNGGYRLVEEALKRRGLTLANFVDARINRPLGLQFAVPEHWGDPVPGLAPGYWYDGTAWQPGLQGMHLSAAGSLAASAVDMARWLSALQAGQGALAGLWTQMTAARALTDGTMTGYGLGLREVRLGDHVLLGHSGAQAGYRAQVLMDGASGAGLVVLSNRDDADSLGLALAPFAALLDVAPPQRMAAGTLPQGLYVAEEGPRWVEVKDRSLVHMGTEEALYDAGEGWVDSRSATSPVRLRRMAGGLEGWIGHAPVRLLPVTRGAGPVTAPGPVPADLDGHWHMADEGAVFRIAAGVVHWGIGPVRQRAPLQPLGGERFLFAIADGPARRMVCLQRTGPDALVLALNRARSVAYTRLC